MSGYVKGEWRRRRLWVIFSVFLKTIKWFSWIDFHFLNYFQYAVLFFDQLRRMVLSARGVDHAQLVRLAEQYFVPSGMSHTYHIPYILST